MLGGGGGGGDSGADNHKIDNDIKSPVVYIALSFLLFFSFIFFTYSFKKPHFNK